MDNLVNMLLGIAVMGLCYVGIKNAEHINELKHYGTIVRHCINISW